MRQEKEMLAKIKQWAQKQESVRAVIIGGSLANPKADTDLMSDYDPMLIVSDLDVLLSSDDWLEDFGAITVSMNTSFDYDGNTINTRLVLYEDGVKIDFSLWPLEMISQIMQEPTLPDFLDAGYMVLLDKEQLTKDLQAPTYGAFITAKPTEEEYLAKIKGFWWNSTYVAKCLWRDELFFAKYMLDYWIRFNEFKYVIEWYIGVKHDWSANPNKCGRWFKRYLAEDVWTDLESTFAGADIQDNWKAFFNTAKLFRKMAIEVGDSLGFSYPQDLDDRVSRYLTKVSNLSQDATDF